MQDSDPLKTPNRICSPLSIAACIQAAFSLAVVAYCLFGTRHMRPILVELFQKPVIPLGFSIGMFVAASVLWLCKHDRIALVIVVCWCLYDIVARGWLFDGHVSTEQHERHVSFGAGLKLYFSLSLFVSVGILAGASQRLLRMSRKSLP